MIFAKKNSEEGSAFILALMVVAAVGLLVVPVIYLATTGLRSTNLAQQRILERYAADAGLEEGIWIIENPAYLPGEGETLIYNSNFNNLPTKIEITLLALPTPIPIPGLTDPVTSQGMTIDKTVIPAYFYPCLQGDDCEMEPVTYKIYIENFGGNPLNLEAIGDCMPEGFEFVEVTGVTNILEQNTKEPLDEDDLKGFQVGPVLGDSSDGDFSCPDERYHVKWVFDSPRPYVESMARAEITFTALALIREPKEHPNMAWVNANPSAGAFENPITMEEPVSVIVKFAEMDISSTAGGTTVNARATVWEFPGGNKEAYIQSWQVE